jgi:hypothetical protein
MNHVPVTVFRLLTCHIGLLPEVIVEDGKLAKEILHSVWEVEVH